MTGRVLARTAAVAVGVLLVAAAAALYLVSARPPGAPAVAARGSTQAPASPTGAPHAERPYSVQLHVHGSFSEGAASIDSHSWEASDVGADVIWWSDHDFRIASYRHASRFGFEGWTEPLDRGEPWRDASPERSRKRVEVKRLIELPSPNEPIGSAEFTADAVDEGERSLRVRATSPAAEFQPMLYHVEAARGLMKRPLAAGVTLHLSVLPETANADARPAIEIVLSEHAPRDGVPLGEFYRLVYVLDDTLKEPEREGASVFLPVPYRLGEWNRLVLPVTRDAIRSFPAIRGEDNALSSIAVGLWVRRGATGSVLFDRLQIEQESFGEASFARQRALIDAVAGGYPRLRELQGVEISYTAQHLNEFSVDTRLIDYDALLAPKAGGARGHEGRDALARRVVEEVHARGGLVSYNHMFGAARESVARTRPRKPRAKEAILEELSQNGALGADILEVGYRKRGGRELDDHLWVWDELALEGLHLVGTGVSDSHGGPDQRWRTSANNFLSWIYARSPEKAALIEGLRAGRVFFGDIVLFDGTLDLVSAAGHRMGQIVVTDRDTDDVAIEIDGLSAGDAVAVVESGRKTETIVAKSASLRASRTVRLDPEQPTVVRLEVRGADGTVKVLSNPITFVRTVPAGGIEPARTSIDLGGLASGWIRGFRLADARSRREGEAIVVELRGSARDGSLELGLPEARSGDARVELDGLDGKHETEGDRIVVSGLSGEGTVRVTWPAER
jgi:hypothetical protein